MIITPESKIQQEIFNYFNNTYCLKHHKPSLVIYSVPNGIPIPMKPNERARALDLLHKTGMVNGVSDLVIQGINGKTLNVEVKIETGFQSSAQIDFQKKIEALEGVYIVVRSLKDFQIQVNDYLEWLLTK